MRLKKIFYGGDVIDLAILKLQRQGVSYKKMSAIMVINAMVEITNNAHKAGYRMVEKRRKK